MSRLTRFVAVSWWYVGNAPAKHELSFRPPKRGLRIMPRHLSDADRLRNRAKRLLQLAARARGESHYDSHYDYATLLKRLATEAFDHAKEIAKDRNDFGLREERLRALAHKLLFNIERTEQRFTLTRTADVSKPERHEALTIEQAEEVLRNWKLRGFHGGWALTGQLTVYPTHWRDWLQTPKDA